MGHQGLPLTQHTVHNGETDGSIILCQCNTQQSTSGWVVRQMENGKVTVYIVRRDSTGHWAVVLGVQTAEVEKCLGMLIIKPRHPRPALTTIILLQRRLVLQKVPSEGLL